MTRLGVLFGMLVILAASSSFAQSYSFTGNDLLLRCDGPYSSDVEKIAYSSFCTGYIQGLQQMQHVVIGLRSVPPLYCEPTQSGTYTQLESVIVKWLKNNPAQLHRDARILATKALMEAFPCSEMGQ